MKITDISTTVTWGGRRNWVIVKVGTDTELFGWGEATLEGKERTVQAAIAELGAVLIGRDPLPVEHHWQRLVDVIQPDLCHAGGIAEVKKIAALAEAYYVQLAPHNPQGPLSTAAAAHLGMAIPNFLILEFVRRDTYRDTAMREAWTIEGGNLLVPDLPGLGVDLDEDALLASPFRRVPRGDGPTRTDGSIADP